MTDGIHIVGIQLESSSLPLTSSFEIRLFDFRVAIEGHIGTCYSVR